MKRRLQLAAAALLLTGLAPSYAKDPKPQKEDVEWMWQYTPDQKNPDGRENDLLQDARFRSLLSQFLTAPQSFWGQQTPTGKPRSLADTAYDFLSVPDKVIGQDSRYITVTGHVFRLAPARGLLWVDLQGKHHLVVFAALDWTTEGRPTTDPAAEYTLWLFPNDPLTVEGPGSGAQHIPAALSHNIANWAMQPLPGSGIVQKITHAVLVDPDGTPHEIPPASLGIRAPQSSNDETPSAGSQPTASPDDSTPILAPRN